MELEGSIDERGSLFRELIRKLQYLEQQNRVLRLERQRFRTNHLRPVMGYSEQERDKSGSRSVCLLLLEMACSLHLFQQ